MSGLLLTFLVLGCMPPHTNTLAIDNDGDGFTEFEGDCDDNEPHTYPGAASIESSEDCMTDADGDGWGDAEPSDGVTAGSDCEDADPDLTPEDADGDGASTCAYDCDDQDPHTFTGAAEYESEPGCHRDADGDGYGDISPNEGVEPGLDCADDDANTFPGAAERDSYEACQRDADGDGYGDNTSIDPVAQGTDCDDDEPALNQLDQDADGVTTCEGDCDDDDGSSYPGAAIFEPILCTHDGDGDGYGSDIAEPPLDSGTDCDDASEYTHPGAAEFDSAIECMRDADGDGFGDQEATGRVVAGRDCDDLAPELNAADTDGDGWTSCEGDCQDTDADISPMDGDGDGFSSCDGDCDDGSDTVYPGGPETWYDGVDSDCDDASDFDADGDGFMAADHGGDDCDDANPEHRPDAGVMDLTDGVDSNCDGYDGLALDYKASVVVLSDTELVDLHYVGDVDGDGRDELAIETADGWLELFSGAELDGTSLERGDAFISIELDMTPGNISGGDVNGDGCADVGFGYPDYVGISPSSSSGGQGMIVILDGCSMDSGGSFVADSGADYVILGNVRFGGPFHDPSPPPFFGSRLGTGLNMTQDIDGDGQNDILAYAPTAPGDETRRGGPYLLLASDLTSGETDFSSGEYTGWAHGHYEGGTWADTNAIAGAIADLNGDGWMEIALNAAHSATGSYLGDPAREAYSYRCTLLGSSFGTARLGPYFGTFSPGGMGGEVHPPGTDGCDYWTNGSGPQTRVGDINGDGFDEAAWGSSLYRTADWVPSAMYESTPDLVIPLNVNVHEDSPPLDFNGDGINDLLIGGGILLGSESITSTSTPDVSVTMENDSIASDFNGDGLHDLATPQTDGEGTTSIYIPGMGL